MSPQVPSVCDMLNERGMKTKRVDVNQRNQGKEHIFKSMIVMGMKSIENCNGRSF